MSDDDDEEGETAAAAAAAAAATAACQFRPVNKRNHASLFPFSNAAQAIAEKKIAPNWRPTRSTASPAREHRKQCVLLDSAAASCVIADITWTTASCRRRATARPRQRLAAQCCCCC